MNNSQAKQAQSQEKASLNLAVMRVDPRDQAIIAAGLYYNKV